MADLRESVRELRGTIDALAAKKEPAQDKVLRLNVREAKSSTSLRVQQLSPATLASMVGSPLKLHLSPFLFASGHLLRRVTAAVASNALVFMMCSCLTYMWTC